MKILITGAAGFIGYHVSKTLLERGEEVIGIDNLNDYYDVNLKYSRRDLLNEFANFEFKKLDISQQGDLLKVFENNQINYVVHLAAQAGVRYSISNPDTYITSNLIGFHNILEALRRYPVSHFVYASSSSVYGDNVKIPFSTEDSVDHPRSLYAATKKSNELLAHSYSHLYDIPSTGLRFFTVYGPWGRPDMALFLFTKAIVEGRPIDIFNNGKMQRDFTYVSDVVEGVIRVLEKPPELNESWSGSLSSSYSKYRIYNIGKGMPIKLMDFIHEIEKNLGIIAKKNLLPMQAGDVIETFADLGPLSREFDFVPATSVQEGVSNFIDWYKNYYQVE